MAGSYDLHRDLQSIQAPVIHFDHVSKEYQKGIHAIEDICISIKKGEFVFIVGSSGSGKSTLIRLMLREILPTKGKVFVAGRELSRLRRHQISKYRRSIGVVFQDFRLLKDRNAYENVAFAQRVVEVPPAEIRKNVPRMLSLVGLSEKYKAFPSELFGGEQQRIALARALVNNPVILLADEPTGNLDPKNSWEIMHLLEEVNRRGTTVVVVTHNHEVVDMMQKRVITLRNGRVISDEQKGGYVYAKY